MEIFCAKCLAHISKKKGALLTKRTALVSNAHLKSIQGFLGNTKEKLAFIFFDLQLNHEIA